MSVEEAKKPVAEPLSQANKRTAIIDIGSNSIRLVVYQGPARVPAILFNEKVMAGLGRGLATTGAIAEESLQIAKSALQRFYRLCREMKVDTIESFATSAVRDASNGKDLLKIARKIGIETLVLQGEEEAQLAGLGVISAIPEADGIVGDLGGGSLELARIKKGKVLETHSFPLGVLRVADQRKRQIKTPCAEDAQETRLGQRRTRLAAFFGRRFVAIISARRYAYHWLSASGHSSL